MANKKEGIVTEVESVLFSSGRWMTIEELIQITGHDSKGIKNALSELRKRYESTDTSSIVLIEDGGRWKLTVKQKYVDLVSKVISQTELPKGVMETLAVIAFKYPILQSEVIKMRTSKAYDHLTELEETGFIIRERQGRTRKIKLTQKFFDYFDIPEGKVRDVFARFDAVEKTIERQEKENASRTQQMKDSDSTTKTKKQPEQVEPLETYDIDADQIGIDPADIDEKDFEVDLSREKPSKESKAALLTALSKITDTEEAGDDPGDVPGTDQEGKDQLKEYPDGLDNLSQPGPEEETDEEDNPGPDTLVEEESLDQDQGIDPFWDSEDTASSSNENQDNTNQSDSEDPLLEETVALPEQEGDEPEEGDNSGGDSMFGNPDLDDESIKEKEEQSNKLLDTIYGDIEKNKDEMIGKMNKNFKPR